MGMIPKGQEQSRANRKSRSFLEQNSEKAGKWRATPKKSASHFSNKEKAQRDALRKKKFQVEKECRDKFEKIARKKIDEDILAFCELVETKWKNFSSSIYVTSESVGDFERRFEERVYKELYQDLIDKKDEKLSQAVRKNLIEKIKQKIEETEREFDRIFNEDEYVEFEIDRAIKARDFIRRIINDFQSKATDMKRLTKFNNVVEAIGKYHIDDVVEIFLEVARPLEQNVVSIIDRHNNERDEFGGLLEGL